MSDLKNRDLLKLLDYTAEDILELVDLAARLKADKKNGRERKVLIGKNIVLLFEKDSTRTRCSFEVAAYDQGANVTYLGPTGSQMGKKESIKDTARVLERMYDGIEYRGYGQNIVEELAEYSRVPVWNGLTDEAHPTQVLADLLTMRESSRKPFENISFCFLGNAYSNVANSLLVAAAKLGMDYRVVAPEGFSTALPLLDDCRRIADQTGARLTVTDNIPKGVKGCDFVYTDVWVSMGESDDSWVQRLDQMLPYRVTSEILKETGNPNVKFMHCLPAFHNDETKIARMIKTQFGIEEMEVTDEVFESSASLVFDQAENRMHTIKAVLVATLYGKY